jgi:hypothetical protein
VDVLEELMSKGTGSGKKEESRLKLQNPQEGGKQDQEPKIIASHGGARVIEVPETPVDPSDPIFILPPPILDPRIDPEIPGWQQPFDAWTSGAGIQSIIDANPDWGPIPEWGFAGRTARDIADKVKDKGQSNALRHAIWMAILTARWGEEDAKIIGDIHEKRSNDKRDTEVDQYNNEVGRQIGKRFRPEVPGAKINYDALITAVFDAFESGKLATDGPDSRTLPFRK